MKQGSPSIDVRGWFIFFATLIIVGWLLFSPADRSKSPEMTVLRKKAEICWALARYQQDHQNLLPERLSDLVPKYIGWEETAVFFSPSVKSGPTNLTTLSEQLDKEGVYSYLGERGRSINIIMYDRLELKESAAVYKTPGTYGVGTNFQRAWYSEERLNKFLDKLEAAPETKEGGVVTGSNE